MNLVEVIFDTMDASGALTFTELKANKISSYKAIFKALLDIEPDLQKEVLQTAGKLAAAGRDVLMEDAELSFKEILSQLAEQLNARNIDK